MSEAYISSLSERDKIVTKVFAFTVVNKILKIDWKGYYIEELTRRYEALKPADKFSFVLPVNSYRTL